MFRRHKGEPAPKRPDNWLPTLETGYGLWEIWWDEGPGTSARCVRWGAGPHIFLVDNEASKAARELARQNPDKRYCVKLKRC